jgi:hypothetical protein
MAELLEKEQVLSVVPQNYAHSNKGKVTQIDERKFLLELFHAPDGIILQHVMEFYSPTPNGMLYFTSFAAEINGNAITVQMPRKHRFLQRRTFTRIKFTQKINLQADGKTYKAESLDLSAGGMKLKTSEPLSIDGEFSLSINLVDKTFVECKFQPTKIEKNTDDSYTVSGRFQNLRNTDKMKLTQFCIRKNVENINR